MMPFAEKAAELVPALVMGKVGHRDSGDGRHPGRVANSAAWPDVWRQPKQLLGRLRAQRALRGTCFFGVPGTGGVNVHIRSGAVTPSIARPLAMTWRVAWHSASRAVCSSFGASSPCGSTRQES